MFTKLPKSTLMWRASIVSFIPRFGNASITKAALRPKTRKEDISLEGRAKCQIKGPKLQRTKARWEPKEWKPSAESQENSTSWSPCQGLLRLLWPDTKTTLSAYVKSALYINIYIYATLTIQKYLLNLNARILLCTPYRVASLLCFSFPFACLGQINAGLARQKVPLPKCLLASVPLSMMAWFWAPSRSLQHLLVTYLLWNVGMGTIHLR